ncbi:MAG: terminase [Nitratireductor sp.]|nr:terminase [Nitratireductor sp.]
MVLRKDLPPDPEELWTEILRTDLLSFVTQVFETLRPGQKLDHAWHIDAMCQAIMNLLYEGDPIEDSRLIINAPPRSLKSIVCSVAMPLYYLGRDPSRNIICISYADELAEKHAGDRRRILETRWYKKVFPGLQLRKNTATEIRTSKGGSIFTTSVFGTLTGRGGDLIVIDDPIKPADAYSKSIRNRTNEWLGSTLASRPDDKRTSKMLLVKQRLHVEAPSAMLSATDDWIELVLPAIATEQETFYLMHGRTHTRNPGDVLDPEREPLDILERQRSVMGELAFQAQYQQRPVPPEGGLFKMAWFKRYDKPPPHQSGDLTVQSWDTAFSEKETADWSVGTTWLIRGDRYYLLDCYRARCNFPDLKRAIVAFRERHPGPRSRLQWGC